MTEENTKKQCSVILKNKTEKGHYGYIDYTKKKALIMSLISLASVLIIFFTGVIIYKTNKSLFSIIAAVASLPAAKLITGYIILRQYKTGCIDIYNTLNSLVNTNENYKAIIGADLIITSPNKAMNIVFAYIINGKVICYTNHSKTDIKEVEQYIKKIFNDDTCQYSQVKVFSDDKKFLTSVRGIAADVGKEYTDKRLFEKLCAYSM